MYRSDNTGDTKVYWDETILRTKHPLIVYGDKEYIQFARSVRDNSLKTEYIEMDISQIPLWSYYDQVESNRQKSWPSADSRCPTAVHLITCSKILLVEDAIKRNPFNTSKFGFIDCNVLKKMKVSVEQCDTLLDHDLTKFHIMAIGVVDDKLSYAELYSRYRYVLSGGFFLCTKEYGLKVAQLFKQEFIRTTDVGYGHGEEMIYTKILNQHWELFELSYGDYSECVTNIFKVVRNHEYVFNYCIVPYSQQSLHRQLKHCCNLMLRSSLAGGLRFKVLYYLYIAYYWLRDSNGVIETLQTMSSLTQSNIQALSEYKKDKGFYDTNLSYANIYCKVPSMLHNTLCLAIPCYKPHLEGLNKLLDSVRSQTRKPDQVIIVSSESQASDAKDIILDNGWLLCLKSDYANASMNRNLLAQLSNCDIISFIDADDTMHERRCELIAQQFENDSTLDVVTHGFNFIGEPNIIEVNTNKDIKLEYKYGYLIPETNQRIHNGHISLKRSIFDKITYNPNLKLGEDVDFNVRLYHEGYKFKYLPDRLSIYNKQSNRTIYGRLVGGMGNQLFIMAKTMYEASRTGTEYYFIADEKTQPYIHNLYAKFNDRFVTPPSNPTIYKEKQWSYYDTSSEIDLCFSLHDCVVLEGYWQSEKHFPTIRDKFKTMLDLDFPFTVDKDVCLIMVRRGDYLKYSDIHNPCNLDYYTRAIELMKGKGITKFYVTSDDLGWCKQELGPLVDNIAYIDEDDVTTLKQAIKFQHFIISNSTFHWFACYLADKVECIVAPDVWIKLPNTDYRSIYTDKMTVINR
jgi:hypothetical protein